MTTATFNTTATQNHPAIQQALQHLADLDRDHASVQNGVGFNGRDTDFGCSLAQQSTTKRLSDKQHELACKLLWRYSNTQLTPAGIQLPVLGDLQKWLQERERVFPYKPATVKLPPTSSSMGAVFLQDGLLTVKMPSNFWAWVKAIKTIQVQGRLVARYLGEPTKYWQLPILYLDELLKVCPASNFEYSKEVLNVKITAEKEQAVKKIQLAIQQEALKAKVEKLMKVANLDKPLLNGWMLKSHQKQAVEFVFNCDGKAIIADEQGVGKTIESLKVAKVYQDIFGILIFVICPVSVIENWKREAQYVGVNITVVSQSFTNIPDPLTVNYGVLTDEAHAFKNMQSKRTKKWLLFTKNKHCKLNIPMTGTPLKNGHTEDIYPLLRSVGHSLGLMPFTHFKAEFSDGSRNKLRSLFESITIEEPVMIRRKAEDVLQLPPFTRKVVYCTPSFEAENTYRSVFEQLQREYEQRVVEGKISSIGWEIVMLNHLRKAGSIAKIQETLNMAGDILQGQYGEGGEPLVIFVCFRETAELLQQNISTYTTCEVLQGGQDGVFRQQLVDRFQSGATKCLICLSQSGGVGITLTAATKAILHDRDWNLFEQCEKRLHRIGQDKPVTIYWNSYSVVDEFIDNRLIIKTSTSSMVLEGIESTIENVNWSVIAQNFLADLFAGKFKVGVKTDIEGQEDYLPAYNECF